MKIFWIKAALEGAVLAGFVLLPLKAEGQGARTARVGVVSLRTSALDVFKEDILNSAVLNAAEKAGKYEVVSGKNIMRLFEYESRRADIACINSLPCLRDVGKYADVDLLLAGKAMKIGNQYRFSLILLEVKKGDLLGLASDSAEDDFVVIKDAIGERTRQLLVEGKSMAVISYSTNVDDPLIDFDGLMLEKESAKIPVTAGAHLITVQKPGHLTFQRKVVVSAAEKMDVKITLVPIEAEKRVKIAGKGDYYRLLGYISAGLAAATAFAGYVTWQSAEKAHESYSSTNSKESAIYYKDKAHGWQKTTNALLFSSLGLVLTGGGLWTYGMIVE